MTTARERALEAALRACDTMMEACPVNRADVRYDRYYAAQRNARAALALPPSPQPPPVAVGEHTPGPWHVPPRCKVTGELSITGPDEMIVAEAKYSRQIANARLIAAAPDMLAALRSARDCILDNPRTPNAFKADALRAIDAALARATGAPGEHPDQPAPEHFAHND